ncbi:MAG: hypothetical protein IPL61_07730 [Myxococcales bacterium]|nr:hypothetical protein [Myxococcales bacterium]
MLFDSIGYVNYGLALPVRVDARVGVMFGRAAYDQEARSLFGAAIAVLPWRGESPDHHTHSEKGWTDLGPDLDLLRGLGVEVAVDALPAPSGAERGLVVTTISLVGDLSTVIAR